MPTYSNPGANLDGLITQAGALTLAWSPQNVLLTGTTLGQVTTTQSYNAFGEVADFTASFQGTPLYAATYTRDQLGRILEKVEALGGVTDTFDYTYDSAERLTDVARNDAALSHYDYDGNGNRTARTSPSGTVTATYDAQDRLLSYGDLTYTWSANGELESRTQNGQTATYSYDELGNLRNVSLPGGIEIEYVIDGQNRRVGKKVNGSLGQGFLYEGQLQPIAELDGTGTVVSRFVYGSGANVPDSMVKGGVTYRILSDHLGSPRLVLNTTTGQVVQRMDYDEFGRVILDTNPGFQPFGFAGGLYDRQVGFVRFGLRDYDPKTGRWTAKDPILFSGGSANLYSYSLDDPVDFRDPLGLYSMDPSCNKWCGPPSIGQCSMSAAGQCVFPMIDDIVAKVFRNPTCRQALEAAGIWRDVAAALMPTSEYPLITCHEANCVGPGSSRGRYIPFDRSIPICSNYFVLRWEMGAQTLFHEILHSIGHGHDETEREHPPHLLPGI